MSDEKDGKKEANPYGLSPDELMVLHHWKKGMSMTDAYKHVMLSPYDQQAIKDSALKKRVLRFFSTYRMKEAMANTPGKRGEKAKQDFEKWKIQQKTDAIKRFAPEAFPKEPENKESEKEDGSEGDNDNGDVVIEVKKERGRPKKYTDGRYFDKMVRPYLPSTQRDPDTEREIVLSYKEQWVRSLSNYGGDPTAVSIYGTGQYLFYTAIKEMMDRKDAIAREKISVLDREGRGSALTPSIIAAIKTAASMVMPFAPAPTADQRKSMQNIAALLSAIPDIEEDPDAYTAPPPNTIDIESNNNNEG